jgi:hypothetical protein
MYVAPKSTEVIKTWGSAGTFRNAISTTNGVNNTNTLYGFGNAAHPAAYYAKTLTTGGYNTWYLPAIDELNTLYSNKSATPFATSNSFGALFYWSSTEVNGSDVWGQYMPTGIQNNGIPKNNTNPAVRATRRSTV